MPMPGTIFPGRPLYGRRRGCMKDVKRRDGRCGMSRQCLTGNGAALQVALPEGDKRVAVVGTTGSGKSVLARTLSQRLDIPHVELDAFYWQPDWTPAPAEAFCMAVTAAIDGPNWIVDGNHSAVRDLVWGRANTLI